MNDDERAADLTIGEYREAVQAAEERGADRERTRLRRALRSAAHNGSIWYLLGWGEIERKTRAPKRKPIRRDGR